MRIALVCTPHVDSTLRLAAQMGASDVVARYPAHLGRTLEDMVAQAKGHGLAISIVEGYIPHDELTHGREGRERQLAGFVDLVRDMARLGVEILCYNFMPDDDWTRTTTTAPERGGALVTAFDAAELDPSPGRGGPITASWRKEYNTKRPHSSLGYLTPAGFAAACAAFASAKASAQAAHAACGEAPCS